MIQWAATEMPRWRHGLVLAMGRDPARYQGWPGRLAEADLYWVTKDMTMVAYDAVEHGQPFTPAAVIPSPAGLLVWNAPLPPLPLVAKGRAAWHGIRPTTAGVMWAQRDGRVDLFFFARTVAVSEQFGDRTFDPHPAGAIMPVTEVTLGPAAETIDLTNRNHLDARLRDVIGLTVMTWELMEQPTVATPRHVTGVGGSGRAHTPQVRRVLIVDLRKLEHVHEDREPGTGRIYSHRWLVGAHPRWQPYGPGRALVKRIWIAPYIKGPAGAPLVQRERVHVWRR